MMPQASELSNAKRALLEKYLRGDLPQTRTSPRRIIPRPPGTLAPLSFGQEQLWIAAQLAGGAPIDTEFITLSIDSPLDVAALERSFDEVIRRHEILRTTVSIVDGQPMQVTHPPGRFALPSVDLRVRPRSERDPEAIRLATEQARQPFDLGRGPLLRATLVRVDDASYKLFLVLHHIIFDCFAAYTVFLPELAALYSEFSAGKTSPLPELAIQYADYATWQRERLKAKEMEDDLAYWRRQLSGCQALELPTDHQSPRTRSFRGEMQSAVLPRELIERLQMLSRREGATLFMTLMAAFQSVLHRYSGQNDVVVGTETGSREQPEIEPLIGFFLNTLVLRTDFSGHPTFREVLTRVRQVTLEAYSHGNVPFQRLEIDLATKGEPSGRPLFQVMMRLGPRLIPLNAAWTVGQVDLDPEVSKFDLTLDLYDAPAGIVCRLEYSTDLFERSTMTQLLAHFRAVLGRIVEDPELHIDDLPIARAREPEWVATSSSISSISIEERTRQNGNTSFVAPSTAKPIVVPSTPLHQQLLQMWEELLDVRPIGYSDDFFALGGTSLLAIRLLSRIEDVLGQKVPVTVLFTGATIEHVAQVIMDGLGPELISPLVQIQPGGSKRPFYFLHGEPNGAGFYSRTLARYLDEDQPFYILQTDGPDGSPPVASVEALAASHVQILRAFQPEGPYLLGGFCSGGTVAYEIARQLEAQGQRVDLLVLMYSRTQYAAKLRYWYRAIASASKLLGLNVDQQVVPYLMFRHLRHQVEDFLRLGPTEQVKLMKGLMQTPRTTSLRRTLRTAFTAPGFGSKAEAVIAEWREKDRRAPVFWACSGYVPGPYAGRVTLFWGSQEPQNRQDPSMGWGRVAREVEIRYVPGHQQTALPHLADIAEQLRACLARVQAK